MDEVLQSERKQKKKELKKIRKAGEKLGKARRVGKNKFTGDDANFNNVNELTGSLREIIPSGNILKDRFLSMQKRSLIEVVKPQFKYVFHNCTIASFTQKYSLKVLISFSGKRIKGKRKNTNFNLIDWNR